MRLDRKLERPHLRVLEVQVAAAEHVQVDRADGAAHHAAVHEREHRAPQRAAAERELAEGVSHQGNGVEERVDPHSAGKAKGEASNTSDATTLVKIDPNQSAAKTMTRLPFLARRSA